MGVDDPTPGSGSLPCNPSASPQPAADFSFEPLTPTSFLARSAIVRGDRLAVVDGALRLTYRELRERAGRLAGALEGLGVAPGGRVAVIAANSHLMLEAHYGVPLARAVLVALNMRLSHEQLIERSSFVWRSVTDERDLLSINYTSGTTGRPKGVMYHHRGAYLQALAMAFHARLEPGSVFLWTLPMFHCNGWCFTWAVTAAGAQHVCLPRSDPAAIWRLIDEAGVTHFNAAPTVLTDLAGHPAAHRPQRPIQIATGGAPPSPALLERFAALGIEITHLYGLTESFGPVVICDWKAEWDELPAERRAQLKARQGVANVIAQPVRVVEPDGTDVAADGETVGEIVLRGNDLMLG